MVTLRPRRQSLAVALLFTLSCVGLIIFVWLQYGGSIPFAARSYQVKALFTETGLLTPGADVRIAGVNVGRVASVSARGVDSEVVMNIDQRYAPIPLDTRAIVRTKTLLGEAYVDLSSGARGGPALPDGGSLPATQVQRAQALDQVLNSFTPPVRRHLQALLDGSGSALAGRGETLNDALGNVDPATSELAAMVGVLHQQQGSLKQLVSGSASVLQTLRSRGSDLESLVGSGNGVLSATAAEQTALRTTVTALPPFLAELRRTLGNVNVTLGLARPSLTALAPVAPLLTPTLRGLMRLATPVTALLVRAPAVLRAAEAAYPAVARFSRAFRPESDALLTAALQVDPMITFVKESRAYLLNSIANTMAILEASTTAQTPGGSAHYIRSAVTFGSDSVWGQTQRPPGQRNNTYLPPGALSEIGRGGMRTVSCANIHNPAQFPVADANVPCRLQSAYPWGHGIATGYYPRLTAQRK